MNKRQCFLLFILGTLAWYVVEVAFRFVLGSNRTTHLVTCFIAGYALIMAVKIAQSHKWIIVKAVLLGLSITLLELALGSFWIYVLKLPRLWNYGKQFLSYDGIICFKWAMLWIGISVGLVLYIRRFIRRKRKMEPIKYTCRKCGETNTIKSFWVWFWTPHLGASKWIKCENCQTRSWQERQDWRCKWLDWPTNKDE